MIVRVPFKLLAAYSVGSMPSCASGTAEEPSTLLQPGPFATGFNGRAPRSRPEDGRSNRGPWRATGRPGDAGRCDGQGPSSRSVSLTAWDGDALSVSTC